MGGNTCKVLFHNKPTNLHALWDEGMIDFTKLSYTELTSLVSQGQKIEDIRNWKTGTATDWAKESKELRSKIYPAGVECNKEVPEENLVKLSYEYSYKYVPVI